MSPVFKQNLYSGVDDKLLPTEIPPDINLFAINGEKYPLLKQVGDYILSATLRAGDCLFVPAYSWYQTRTLSEQSMLLKFGYESHSKLTDLLFDAINEGILED